MFCSKCGKETTENAVFCAGCGASLAGGQPMKKTGLSTAAGILDIVAGVFTILSVFCMLFFVAALKSFVEGLGEEFQVESDFASLIVPGVTVIGGIVAIVAGILLLRKKNRTRAIVGAVGSTLTLSPLGVAALVVTIVARREFER